MARSTTTSARRGPELPLAPGTGSISGACVIGVIIDDAAAGPVPRIVGSGTGSGRPPGTCGHSGTLRMAETTRLLFNGGLRGSARLQHPRGGRTPDPGGAAVENVAGQPRTILRSLPGR